MMDLDQYLAQAIAPIHLPSKEYHLIDGQVEMMEKLCFSVLNVLPEPMLIVTADEVILFANHAARELLSSTEEDLKGTSLSSFLPHRSKKFNDWLQKATCSETFVSEQLQLMTRKGTMSFYLEGSAVHDSKRSYVLIRLNSMEARRLTVRSLAVQVDKLQQEIAMRRAAEERLQESLIELARAKKQLEQLATIDSLTGIPNRRSIDDALQREWLKAMRNSESLAVIMIDIDHFKKYNDFYGHQAGDVCLRRVAQAIRSVLRRSTDYVGRYGGEEFIVLLTHSDWEKARKTAERIFEAVHLLKLPHLASPTASTVTISAGINVMVPLPKLSLDTLIQQADEALYQAKRNGRDQFVLYQRLKTVQHREKKMTNC